jgi:hypothetical protein
MRSRRVLCSPSAGAVDRWIARQYWAIFAALGRQTRRHAADRVRIERLLGTQPSLHHCGRDLRCCAHGQDCLHSCRRVSLRGNDGSIHRLDYDSGFHNLAHGLDVCAIRAGNTHCCRMMAGSGQTPRRFPGDEEDACDLALALRLEEISEAAVKL